MENVDMKRTVSQLLSGAEGKLSRARSIEGDVPSELFNQLVLLMDSIAASLLAIAKIASEGSGRDI